jgi:hypothetical protein
VLILRLKLLAGAAPAGHIVPGDSQKQIAVALDFCKVQ